MAGNAAQLLLIACLLRDADPRVPPPTRQAQGPVQQRPASDLLTLSAQHELFLQQWLAKHPDLRPARMEDCEDRVIDSAGRAHVESCRRLVAELRAWTKDPTTNPFYAAGDFNADGEEDFAVVLTDSKVRTPTAKPATVEVFNGPFRDTGPVDPAFSMTGRLVSERFVGYGPPRPKPWHLIIGSPESEGGALVWRNGRYILR